MAARIVLTYADYATIPDDGKRYELHDGDLSVTPVTLQGERPVALPPFPDLALDPAAIWP